ncbi:MAG: cobalamin B12-binding domain-containing protein [Thermodesulfobacteriota bacterium]
MQSDLMCSIEELPEIPQQSIKAYKDRMGELVEKVNSVMASRADISMLTGGNPAGMMFDNHKNHALFMRNVFALNAWGLLVKTVPWVYRTYHNHGFDYEYFPAHLQSWVRALGELLHPDDAAPLISVYEWMLARHDDFIRAAQNYSPVLPEPSSEWKETFDAFVRGLLNADRKACTQLAARSVNSSAELADFYLNVIQPAMYEVGRKWEAAEISVAGEHIASAIVNRIMSMQYLEFMEQKDETRGKAAISAGANEFHEIGTAMVANVMEADGWDVAYLGANTPAEELLEFISAGDFDIAAISVTMVFNLEYVRGVIRQIRSWPGHTQPWIMVGGLVFKESPELSEKLGADGCAADCRQAALLADRWMKKKANETL